MTVPEWKAGLTVKCAQMERAAHEMSDYIDCMKDITQDEEDMADLAEHMVHSLMLMNTRIDAILN